MHPRAAPKQCDGDGGRRDAETRRIANAWLRTFAKTRAFGFADYNGVADGEGRLRADLSEDGLHPNVGAYALMGAILADAVKVAGIRSANKKKPADRSRSAGHLLPD